jgi:hypothetical protein
MNFSNYIDWEKHHLRVGIYDSKSVEKNTLSGVVK